MEVATLATSPRPATHDASLSFEQTDPIQLILLPAPGSAAGHEQIELRALPFVSGRLLKAQIRSRCPNLQRLADSRLRLLYRGVELADDSTISGHVGHAFPGTAIELHLLVLTEQDGTSKRDSSENDSFRPGLYVAEAVPCPVDLARQLHDCLEGLRCGVLPVLASGGTGGTYFLHDSDGRKLAVFKPKDEEAGTPQNPRGYEGFENSRGAKPGVPSAQRATREVAAYLLDHGSFAGVPATTIAHGLHRSFVPLKASGETIWKVGSFQALVDTVETADNFNPNMFPVADVHRIGILDLRLANCDRNYGNILVKASRRYNGSFGVDALVPIDHGCSIPDRLAIHMNDVVWLAWPQAKRPFAEEELAYIAALDAERDAAVLAEKLGLERAELRLLEVATCWLQKAAACGLTLYDIGSAIFRTEKHTASLVEHAIADCIEAALQVGMFSRTWTADCSGVAGSSSPATRSDGGIFLRRTNRGQPIEWTPALEETFRRHVCSMFDRLAQRLSREKKAAEPASEAPKAVCSSLDSVGNCQERQQPGNGGDCVPFTKSAPAKKKYIPPHLRRRAAEEAVQDTSSSNDARGREADLCKEGARRW